MGCRIMKGVTEQCMARLHLTLQSWNILSFDPKNTDIDEHIDLINTLGDMVDQKEEAKM